MSINQVFLSGNICKDPELRKTQTGKDVCSFTLATNEGKDKTEFHKCVAWDKTGEIIGAYVKKGNKLAVVGRLQTRKWTDKDGVEKYTTEIVVHSVDLPAKGAGVQETRAPEIQDDISDDIPF